MAIIICSIGKLYMPVENLYVVRGSNFLNSMGGLVVKKYDGFIGRSRLRPPWVFFNTPYKFMNDKLYYIHTQPF